jgi:hypothetical protein
MEQYSVLTLVHTQGKKAHFTEAMQSPPDQMVRTDDFVIVCDSLLTKELEAREEGK